MLALAVTTVVGAEWPRLESHPGAHAGADARRRRDEDDVVAPGDREDGADGGRRLPEQLVRVDVRGQAGLPANINPYQLFGQTTTAVGAVLPVAGSYDVVLDTPAAGVGPDIRAQV